MLDACEDPIRDLMIAVDRLVTLIASEDGNVAEDELRIIESYRQDPIASVRGGAQQSVLKAVNILTTVNRGIADTAWVSDRPAIGEAALDVTRSAILAAECLRAASGMPF